LAGLLGLIYIANPIAQIPYFDTNPIILYVLPVYIHLRPKSGCVH